MHRHILGPGKYRRSGIVGCLRLEFGRQARRTLGINGLLGEGGHISLFFALWEPLCGLWND